MSPTDQESPPMTEAERQLAISFMTTEHFTLQTARSITVSESSSRAMLFMSTLSSSLVALGFAALASDFRRPFLIFASLILPPIAFLGLLTFQRTVQSGIEDDLYSRGIGRIRHFYAETVPAMRPYFVQPTSDERASAVDTSRMRHPGWQILLTIASVVAIMNSVVVGAIVGLLVTLAFDATLVVAIICGGIATVIATVAHIRYERTQWAAAGRGFTALFPGAPPPGP